MLYNISYMIYKISLIIQRIYVFSWNKDILCNISVFYIIYKIPNVLNKIFDIVLAGWTTFVTVTWF